jgi:hypothetical protein
VVTTDEALHKLRGFIGVFGNKVRKAFGECVEEIGVPKMVLSEYKVGGLAAILGIGLVLEYPAETPTSVHGVQDLEERDYAEARLFSLDANVCFFVYFAEQFQWGGRHVGPVDSKFAPE